MSEEAENSLVIDEDKLEDSDMEEESTENQENSENLEKKSEKTEVDSENIKKRKADDSLEGSPADKVLIAEKDEEEPAEVEEPSVSVLNDPIEIEVPKTIVEDSSSLVCSESLPEDSESKSGSEDKKKEKPTRKRKKVPEDQRQEENYSPLSIPDDSSDEEKIKKRGIDVGQKNDPYTNADEILISDSEKDKNKLQFMMIQKKIRKDLNQLLKNEKKEENKEISPKPVESEDKIKENLDNPEEDVGSPGKSEKQDGIEGDTLEKPAKSKDSEEESENSEETKEKSENSMDNPERSEKSSQKSEESEKTEEAGKEIEQDPEKIEEVKEAEKNLGEVSGKPHKIWKFSEKLKRKPELSEEIANKLEDDENDDDSLELGEIPSCSDDETPLDSVEDDSSKDSDPLFVNKPGIPNKLEIKVLNKPEAKKMFIYKPKNEKKIDLQEYKKTRGFTVVRPSAIQQKTALREVVPKSRESIEIRREVITDENNKKKIVIRKIIRKIRPASSSNERTMHWSESSRSPEGSEDEEEIREAIPKKKEKIVEKAPFPKAIYYPPGSVAQKEPETSKKPMKITKTTKKLPIIHQNLPNPAKCLESYRKFLEKPTFSPECSEDSSEFPGNPVKSEKLEESSIKFQNISTKVQEYPIKSEESQDKVPIKYFHPAKKPESTDNARKLMFTINQQPITRIISIPADKLKDKGRSLLKIPLNKTLPKVSLHKDNLVSLGRNTSGMQQLSAPSTSKVVNTPTTFTITKDSQQFRVFSSENPNQFMPLTPRIKVEPITKQEPVVPSIFEVYANYQGDQELLAMTNPNPTRKEKKDDEDSDEPQFLFEDLIEEERVEPVVKKKKRKEAQIPKIDDFELLDDPGAEFTMPERPAINVFLMQYLANLRATVRGLLNKINVSQVDFYSYNYIKQYMDSKFEKSMK